MPAKTWKPARVTTDTLTKIDAVRESLLRGHETGRRSLEFGKKGEVSFDQIVSILCDQYLDHKARSNRKPKGNHNEPQSVQGEPESAR